MVMVMAMAMALAMAMSLWLNGSMLCVVDVVVVPHAFDFARSCLHKFDDAC